MKTSQIIKFEGTRLVQEGRDDNLGRKGELHRVRTAFLLRDVEQVDEVGDPSHIFEEDVPEPITFVVLAGGPVYLLDSFDVVNAAWEAYLNRKDIKLPPKTEPNRKVGQGYGSNL